MLNPIFNKLRILDLKAIAELYKDSNESLLVILKDHTYNWFKNIDKLKKDANIRFKKKDYTEAIKIYEKIIELNEPFIETNKDKYSLTIIKLKDMKAA